MAITVKELEALRAADKGRFLADGGSLYGTVYVATDGAVSVRFRFQYKLNNTRRTIQVGTWPQAGLAEIRRTRDGLRATIQSGIDPVAQGQAARQQRQEQEALDQQRRAAELEAQRVKIEADRQQAILAQQQRLQALAEIQARLSVRGLFEQWHRLELVGRADGGTERACVRRLWAAGPRGSRASTASRSSGPCRPRRHRRANRCSSPS